jgi:hypothetical protein
MKQRLRAALAQQHVNKVRAACPVCTVELGIHLGGRRCHSICITLNLMVMVAVVALATLLTVALALKKLTPK